MTICCSSSTPITLLLIVFALPDIWYFFARFSGLICDLPRQLPVFFRNSGITIREIALRDATNSSDNDRGQKRQVSRRMLIIIILSSTLGYNLAMSKLQVIVSESETFLMSKNMRKFYEISEEIYTAESIRLYLPLFIC